MFLLYYVWSFFIYLIFYFKNILEKLYIYYNELSSINKRYFSELSYFEKLFLIFFFKKNIFKNSLSNLWDINSIFKKRKDSYPLIFFFHLYKDKSNYKFFNLNSLNKHYLFFKKSFFFSKFKIIKYGFLNKNCYKNKNLITFLIIQRFLNKRYYNIYGSLFFKKTNKNNLIKLNWLFYIYLYKAVNFFNIKNPRHSIKFYRIYDLSKYSDWYEYNFNNKSQIFNMKKNSKILYKLAPYNLEKLENTEEDLNFIKFIKLKLMYTKKIFKKYNLFYKKNIFNFVNVYNTKINFYNIYVNKILFKKNWLFLLKKNFIIRYSETSLSKFIKLDNVKNYLIFYIRKNKIFNKGRYSRNRQLYRTGVYWCLWLNIILVYGLYFLFYRFTFNFGYFWWGLLILFYSTIFSKVVKYNFYNIFYLKDEFINFFKWAGIFLKNIKRFLIELIYFYTKNNYRLKFFDKNFFYKYVFNKFYSKISWFQKYFLIKNYNTYYYIVKDLEDEDESFMKYKTILHWFREIYRKFRYTGEVCYAREFDRRKPTHIELYNEFQIIKRAGRSNLSEMESRKIRKILTDENKLFFEEQIWLRHLQKNYKKKN